MAHKYPYPGGYAWNLEQCEEEIVIAAYVEILRLISPKDTWIRRLNYYFLERGDGLSCEYLDKINAACISCGLEQIEFRETECLNLNRIGCIML